MNLWPAYPHYEHGQECTACFPTPAEGAQSEPNSCARGCGNLLTIEDRGRTCRQCVLDARTGAA